MNKINKHILLILMMAMPFCFYAGAQTADKQKSRIKVEFFKDSKGSEHVLASIRVKADRYIPFENATIHFYTVNDTARVLLDKINTNADGEAVYVISDQQKIYKDSLGFMTFEVEYNGSETIKSAHKSNRVKQVNIATSFFQEDTLKFISADVYENGPDNIRTAIEKQEVFFYIKGTFSLYSIGKGRTDKEGNIKLDFPVDMPGDTSGVLTIVAQIEDSDIYGNVESLGDINWGIPVPLKVLKHRGLGDTDAPLWMVYTLITLLSIVWFTYMYVIFLIIKIKLDKDKNLIPAMT